MLDSVVDQAYSVARVGQLCVFWFQELAMSKFPYGPAVIMFAHVSSGALAVHAANKDKPRQYWLHSLVMTVLACFGGGIIVPVIMAARPSIILANDLALFSVFVMWYLINYCGFDVVLNWKPVKFFHNLVLALWRTNGTINNVNLGVASIKPGIYYPTPLFGPLIGGTLVNCLGQFVPFDKGLTPIQKATSWPIQSAFVSAAIYYFIVKDRDGFIGQAVRSVVGDLSHRAVAAIIVAMQMLTLSAQVIFNDPDANFLTPVHKCIYYISRMQGPLPAVPAAPAPASAELIPARKSPTSVASETDNAKMPSEKARAGASAVSAVTVATPAKKKSGFAKFEMAVRLVLCALFGLYLVSQRVPPVSLPAVQVTSVTQKNGADYVTMTAVPMAGLSVERPIGNCQWKSLFPAPTGQCAPFSLRLEEHHFCNNGTCAALPDECIAGSGRAPRVGCTQTALKTRQIDGAQFRLALHPAAQYDMPSLVRTATPREENLLNTNTPWATELPPRITSSDQLAALDPQFRFDKVSLFLTTESELLLVSDVDFAGSIFDATQISARVLWRGAAKHTCGNTGAGNGHGVKAESLYLDAQSGYPHLRCSDGSHVALNIGSVHRVPLHAHTGMSGLSGSGVVPSSVKMEL